MISRRNIQAAGVKITIWHYAIMVFACCISVFSQASQYTIDNLDQALNLLEHSSIYEDSSGQTLPEIMSQKQGWIPFKEKILPPSVNGTAAWVKIQLRNESGKNYYRYIAFDNPLFDSVDVYIFKDSRQIHHYQAGEAYPFDIRPIKNRNFLFPLQIDKSDKITLYFRLSGAHTGPTSITLVSPDKFADQDQVFVAIIAFYTGLMTIIFIYYTAIFFVTRKKEFISYSCFVLLSTIFVLVQHGLAFQYLWPNNPKLALLSDPLSLMLSTTAGYWFLLEFCHLKINSPLFYRVISSFIAFQIFLICGYLAFELRWFFEWAIRGLIPGILCAITIVSLLAFKGSSAAKSYALAWLFLSIGTLVQVFANLGFIERHLLVDNGFMIGNIFYVLTLSLSLAQLIYQMETDRLQAISLSKTKSEFFAKMSHELRTPIHGVLGLVELLIDTPMNDFQKRYINLINITGKSLLSVVNDLLDYSKVEAGEMTLNEETFSIQELTEEVSAIFAHNYKHGDVPLRLNIGAAGEGNVRGDKEKIKQVLINLLSNAFKFSSNGEVKLTILRDKITPKNYTFQVEDSGKGIPADEIEHLFDAFYQVKKHQSGNIKGTGLGLAICHQMVDLMSGRISVTSKVGEGSLFSFDIPLLPEQVETTKKNAIKVIEAKTDKPSLSVLVAEDNITNQIVIQGMMKKLHYKVTIVENGQDALEALNNKDSVFDLVLMDHDMPIMNGVDATLLLRVSDSIHKSIPIIAMTAHSSEKVRFECLRAGMNAFLSKPVSLSQLDNKIQELMPAIKAEA